MHIRYSAAACQTDLSNPIERPQMRANTDRMLSMIDSAVAGAAPFLPVRLVVFPEFAHAAPVFPTVEELLEKLAIPIPNEHTERLAAKARAHGIYIQTGTMLEADSQWPGAVFNTTCLLGPEGLLYKYRKVNTWIPYEVHASPHDLKDYEEPMFPVADTPIGRDRLTLQLVELTIFAPTLLGPSGGSATNLSWATSTQADRQDASLCACRREKHDNSHRSA